MPPRRSDFLQARVRVSSYFAFPITATGECHHSGDEELLESNPHRSAVCYIHPRMYVKCNSDRYTPEIFLSQSGAARGDILRWPDVQKKRRRRRAFGLSILPKRYSIRKAYHVHLLRIL